MPIRKRLRFHRGNGHRGDGRCGEGWRAESRVVHLVAPASLFDNLDFRFCVPRL
jgi:hypothetical protein